MGTNSAFSGNGQNDAHENSEDVRKNVGSQGHVDGVPGAGKEHIQGFSSIIAHFLQNNGICPGIIQDTLAGLRGFRQGKAPSGPLPCRLCRAYPHT